MSKANYKQAARYFVETVAQVRPDQWDEPGLGEWNVRELVAHTARAMLTVEQFPKSDTGKADVPSSAAYYQRAFVGQGTNEKIAERGRQTAIDLGDDLATAVAEIEARVVALIDTLSDDDLVASLVGNIRLADYLPTRTMELIVHTLDLQEATGIQGTPPREALQETLRLIADLATDSPNGPRLALLATGRNVPDRFSVLG